MAEKILTASGKGGVGKSTFSYFLGKALAGNGHKTLLIDGDAGLGALDILCKKTDDIVYSWLDVCDGNCSLKEAVKEVCDNLYLLPSPKNVSDDIPDDALKNISDLAENDYDIMIIDSAAGVDDNFRRGIAACTRCIFIATADEVSVRCAAQAAEQAEKAGISRDDMRIVINRFRKKEAMKTKLLNIDGVIDRSGVMLLGLLPEDKDIPYMSVSGKEPDKKSRFIKAVNRICKRTEGENIPLDIGKFR